MSYARCWNRTPNTIPDSKPPITPPQDLLYTTLTTTLLPIHKQRFVNAPAVCIVQRMTTALEAAGLIHKKSDQKFRKEEQDKGHDCARAKDNHKAREREENDKQPTSGDDLRSSGAPHNLTKSPPSKPTKDGLPNTPEMEPDH
ncbi:hypothetical protein JB92DRAFT_3132755 [Gautieria morchelliformis]|nr:hypothetical protein JB92DRAFT_3132755 [Gautieria morchelliformis]